jgi:hypothetical protein
MNPSSHLAKWLASKGYENFATLFPAFNESSSFEELQVFRYGIQSSVEWFCDIQKASWPIRELRNDGSPSWVRNRGQYVCQLIHHNITP